MYRMTPRLALLICIAGALPPLAAELWVWGAGFDPLFGVPDANKYYDPALMLLETGRYVIRMADGTLVPNLDTLPVYPYFLYFVFRLIGSVNYWVPAILQAGLAGLTCLAVGLAARSFNAAWMVPGALLCAVWLNLAYRPTHILNESLFMLFFTWGLCALLWISHRQRVRSLLLLAGLAFGFAYMTRPVLLAFPYVVTPALAYLLYRDVQMKWPQAIAWALVPILLMMSFSLPNYVRSYVAYGTPYLTVQRGINLAYYYYPCLAARWGCGDVNTEAEFRLRKQIADALAALPPDQRENVVVEDQIASTLAIAAILELGPAQIARGIVGSMLKLLLHTPVYEILERFRLPTAYLGRMPGDNDIARMGNFILAILTTPTMLVWLIAQLALFASRAVQMVGLWRLFADPATRARTVLLFAYATAVLGVSISLGNPRYRVPLEPGLILLTLAGGVYLYRRWACRPQPDRLAP